MAFVHSGAARRDSLGEGGPRQRRSGALVNGVLETIFPALFHTASALSAPSGHLPLEGKAAIREYHPLKRRHTTLVNLSAPPYRHPERSRGIFIALPP